jgi:predicted transcriptional regulator
MRRVPLVQLKILADKGLGVRAIAKELGFSGAAISKALKRVTMGIAEQVTLRSAGEIVSAKVDALAQLQKINANANELLDLLMRWNRGDEEALQILETQVRKVKVRGSEEEITEYKFKDPRELALKCMCEIRGQLNLQLDIFKALYDFEAVQDFQKAVLEAIKEVTPDVRDRIVQNLKKSKALRSALDVN